MVEIEVLERTIDEQELKGIYLLYGEETFLLESLYKKIRKKFGEKIEGINYIVLDNTNLDSFVGEMQTPAFGYEKKLIVLKHTELLKKEGKKKNLYITQKRDEILEYIKENKEEIEENVVVVILEEDCDERIKIFKYLNENHVACVFKYQQPFKIEKRLIALINAYGVNVDTRVIKYLIESSGVSMQDLINESRKLIEYKSKGGTIEKEDVDKLVTKKTESVIFDLTNELGKKNIKKALMTLDNLIYSKEPLQMILVMLYKHFKRLYITKQCMQNSLELQLYLNVQNKYALDKYKEQAKVFSEKELRVLLEELRNLDYSYKNGRIDLRIGIESILCKNC